MAAKDDLKVWASVVVVDPIYLTPNKYTIPDDLWFNGWLRENPVAGQHLNEVLNIITDALKNETLTPSLNLADVTNTSTALSNLGALAKASNLSDLPNKLTARANLDVPKTSDTLLKSGNLAGIVNVATARDNLGLNTDTLFNTFFDKVYPVGTVYENKTNSANPNTYLGRGTWVAEGQGRVAVGAGSGTDTRGETITFTAGATGGEYKHVMTPAELAAHTHSTNWPMYTEAGSEQNHVASGGTNLETQTMTLATESTGSSTPFNVTQPYSVYYRWLRTI
jgi:hypothetical protein